MNPTEAELKISGCYLKNDGSATTEDATREAERVAGAATSCSVSSLPVAERHRLIEVDAERV